MNICCDSASIFTLNSNPKQGLFSNPRELAIHDFMDSPNQNSSGLLRFRLAPGSCFENLSHGVDKNGDNSSGNDGFDSKFNLAGANNGGLVSQGSLNLEESSSSKGYAVLNSQLPPQYPRKIPGVEMDHSGQPKLVSSFLRQNSSPPALFSPQNGYAGLRGDLGGCYRLGNGINGASTRCSSRLKPQMSNFSSVASSLGVSSQITKVENKSYAGTVTDDDGKPGNGNSDTRFYSCDEFPFSSWSSDSPVFAEGKTFISNTQIGELGPRPHILSHHLSLPKTLQSPESVPCKIRAKRGCATHPRSIAERVRRTRISERMRKLQELVPNMDKQTNTADMLDLAVEYIKDLQKQYQALDETRANCKCSAMLAPLSNRTV